MRTERGDVRGEGEGRMDSGEVEARERAREGRERGRENGGQWRGSGGVVYGRGEGIEGAEMGGRPQGGLHQPMYRPR